MSKQEHEVKQNAIAEMNRIAKSNGGKITPRELVEAARDDANPLHDYFEWDDTVAGEKYREMQARALIRSCVLKFKVENRRVEVPRYVRDPDVDGTEQGYVEVARLRTEADSARDVMVKEFQRAASLITRARKLAHYFDLVDEFDDFSQAVDLMRQHIVARTGVELNA